MRSVLPSRRFRDVQLLIGVALVLLLAVAVAQLQGILTVSASAIAGERRATAALARTLAAAHGGRALAATTIEEGAGYAVVTRDGVFQRFGDAGPGDQPWWPWPNPQAWESAGRVVAGPLEWSGRSVTVAYQAMGGGRTLRYVRPVREAVAQGRWRWTAGALTLLVAGCGALLAWLLLGRALVPYRELLDEAARVGGASDRGAEDRFLVETFRETVRRLESSEAELRRRADELELLAGVLTRGTEAGVVIVDAQDRIRAANSAAEALLGASLENGQDLPPVMVEASRETEIQGRVLEVRRHPLLNAAGVALGGVLFIADRTRERGLERALQEREGMATVGELAAGMAHELRNALATITGYLRLLPDAGSEETGRYIALMRQEAGAVGQILDRFLGFSQPREVQREPIDLTELARERVESMAATLPAVPVEVSGASLMVEGDRLALSVALDNLIRNAAEASAVVGGSVAVTVEATPGEVCVRVEDSGPGVDPEVRDRLFTPFASSKPSGGLGLALARRFARLHGGEVAYHERPGGGSCFTLTLPREGGS